MQLVDLIARYLPVVIPLMNVSTKTASFIIVSRLGFVVSCIMSTVYTRSFLADFWYLAIQQSLIALTVNLFSLLSHFHVCAAPLFVCAKPKQQCLLSSCYFISMVGCARFVLKGFSRLLRGMKLRLASLRLLCCVLCAESRLADGSESVSMSWWLAHFIENCFERYYEFFTTKIALNVTTNSECRLFFCECRLFFCEYRLFCFVSIDYFIVTTF